MTFPSHPDLSPRQVSPPDSVRPPANHSHFFNLMVTTLLSALENDNFEASETVQWVNMVATQVWQCLIHPQSPHKETSLYKGRCSLDFTCAP